MAAARTCRNVTLAAVNALTSFSRRLSRLCLCGPRWLAIRDGSHRDAGAREVRFRFGDRVVGVVEDRRGERRIGASFDEPGAQMVELADATRCDHRDRYCVGDGSRELEIVAFARAVAIHAREKDFARPRSNDSACPPER